MYHERTAVSRTTDYAWLRRGGPPGLALDLECVPSHDVAVLRLLRSLWSRVVALVDDSLPMPPEQRAARDWTPESSESGSARRRLRLRLHMLEKRGKGGFR